jgi:hypothetical protein
MQRSELREELDHLGVDPETYSLNDEYREGCIAISQQSLERVLDFLKVRPIGKWAVFYCYQGAMLHRHYYATESEACEHLLERLTRGLTMKQKYHEMNVRDLKCELDAAGVNPREYAINGDDFPGDQFVVGKDSSGVWEVFYTERGYRSEQMNFKSESAACEHFLDWVLSSKRWLKVEQA